MDNYAAAVPALVGPFCHHCKMNQQKHEKNLTYFAADSSHNRLVNQQQLIICQQKEARNQRSESKEI
jgi:hypothetical protein